MALWEDRETQRKEEGKGRGGSAKTCLLLQRGGREKELECVEFVSQRELNTCTQTT